MKVAVIGTGYVGLVTGAVLAKYGNQVTCIDIDAEKVAQLNEGKVPIYEEGLDAIVQAAVREHTLSFTTDYSPVADAAVSFIAVPTPSSAEGDFDLSCVLAAAKEIGRTLKNDLGGHVIAIKSTVTPEVPALVERTIQEVCEHSVFDVVMNPEFLQEGRAVKNFESPDRIIVGANSDRARVVMQELYSPFSLRENKLILVSPSEAALAKLAANTMLAARIAAANEIAIICGLYDADWLNVRRCLATDDRIGDKFLYAGPGYGGSCFPKDVPALVAAAISRAQEKGSGYIPLLLSSVEAFQARATDLPVNAVARKFCGMLGAALSNGSHFKCG